MAGELRFEWSSRKAAVNLRKHKVSFELAAHVFDDPCVFEFDDGERYGEARYRAIGEILGQILFVSYESYEDGSGEITRIISARKATPRERRAYERHSQNYR